MYSKAKYHLYESAHSGLLPDKPVNLLPKTWTTRTITDGFWMTDNTLSALNWRDYFLANMIDEVDEDKKNHYVGASGIVINHNTRTISFSPSNQNYEFDENSGMFFIPQPEYVYTKVPATYGDNIENKIKIIDGYLNYDLSAKEKKSWEMEPIPPIEKQGLSGNVTEFPNGANVVLVTTAILSSNNSTHTSGTWYEKESGSYWDFETSSRVTWDATATQPTTGENIVINTSSNVFNPCDDTPYTGGYTGGSNFISGDVDMVPSGVLFIF